MAVTGGWGRSLGGGVGIPGKKLGGGGGLEGWPVRLQTGGGEWFRGGQGDVAAQAGHGRRRPTVRPAVAGGSGGWRLKINCSPLISYPMAGKSTDQK